MTTKINIADVQALIAFSILNNKRGVINAMNSSGYLVPENISDSDLFDSVAKIGDEEGIKKLQSILYKVTIDKSKITEEQARNLSIKFGNVPANAQAKSNWFQNLATQVGDFFSGTTVVNQNPNVTTQNSEPVLSPLIIVITAIIGIVSIVLLNRGEGKKNTAISFVIGIIVLGVVLYGVFAKNQTITSSGGGGSQTVHNGALGWLQGILDGLHVSVVG